MDISRIQSVSHLDLQPSQVFLPQSFCGEMLIEVPSSSRRTVISTGGEIAIGKSPSFLAL